MMSAVKILVYKNGNKDFYIEVGKSYQIVPKYDADAPDGFRTHRTTKVLDPDIVDPVNLAVWDLDRNVYDTGLEASSKALNKLYNKNQDEVNTALKTINKEIANKLLTFWDKSQLDPKNLEFWDDMNAELGVDNVFNTNDPLQLYKLYQLILQGKLCPSGLEGEPQFKKSASFSVEDKTTVIDVSQKRELNKTSAKAKFFNMLEQDPKIAVNVMEYMGVTGLSHSDIALLNSTFSTWIDRDDNQNPKKFLETYKEVNDSESGKRVFEVFGQLRELQKNNKIDRKVNGLYFGEHFLGKNNKEAAEKAVNDPILLDKIYETTDA